MDNQYWATMPVKEAVGECESRRKEFYKYTTDKGFQWIWGLVYSFNHSATARGALTQASGEWNELQDVKINEFRNLLQHKVGIVISQRPTWEPMAQNSDSTSLTQTILSKSILSYYTEIKGYDKKFSRAAQSAAKFGEGFIVQTWDASAGKAIAKLPTQDAEGNDISVKINEGDLDCRVLEPIDVIRDCSITEQDQNHWYITRLPHNKWDLAARYPALYDEIVACTLKHEDGEHYLKFSGDEVSKDLVYVYTLYHKKTSALPEGRIISYINPDIVLSATPMSYEDFPVHRMIDVPIPNTNFSYTDAFDMLQPADLLDGLISTVITNQRAFGIQNIIMPIGSNISESQMGGALNIIEFDALSGGKPEALELLKTPAEIFTTIDMMRGCMGRLAGVNGTAQGDPPTGVTSGVALSMLQSLNIQYNQGLQESFINEMSTVGTALINIVKQNAKSARVVQIVGVSKASKVREFVGDDLKGINRVIARPANPMSQTIQGRYAMVDMLSQKGLITDPGMLLTVLETGNMDVATEGKEMSNINIKAENEFLKEGKQIPVRVTDDHVAHLREHANLSSDVYMRTAEPNSPEAKALEVILAHEAEHIKYLGDPQFAPLLIALGQQPLQLQPGQIGYTAPTAAPAAPPTPPGAPALAGNTNIAVNAGGQAATAAAMPAPANQTSQAIGQPKAPQGTPVGQIPQGLIDIANKKPTQG